MRANFLAVAVADDHPNTAANTAAYSPAADWTCELRGVWRPALPLV